jgi:hypothetical protein
MKTDNLIRALAADSKRSVSVERALALAVVPVAAIVAVLFLATMGWRDDIAFVAAEFAFLIKFVIALALAATATMLALRLARPAAHTSPAAFALLAAPLVLAVAIALELNSVEPQMRTAKLVGTTWATCLTFIPLLSLPILAAALLALRHCAPTRPALAGAVAGLLAAGLGAAIYAAYCVEDSAFFFLAWYSTAILIVTAAGAFAGTRVLRW